MAAVHQISVSNGGVPKLPMASARVEVSGVVGDGHDDTVHHGGPDRALCLFSLEVIEQFREEGHPIGPGSAGENLTIAGLDWSEVVPGTRWRVGPEAEIEITSFTSPCATNARWFIDGDFTRMLQSRHPGESRVYARVLVPGPIADGDEVVRLGQDEMEESPA
jgi:MOSC domain-containing protein YiiM